MPKLLDSIIDELPDEYRSEEVFRICLERAYAFICGRRERYYPFIDAVFDVLKPQRPPPWFKYELKAILEGERVAEAPPAPTEASLPHPERRPPSNTRPKLMTFIDKLRPGMSWEKCLEKWNKKNPDHQYKNVNSIKANYWKIIKDIELLAVIVSQDG